MNREKQNMDQQIIDSGDLRKYRTELPNLIDDMDLDPYEYRLYGHYKRVCGAAGGTCYQSVRTTAEQCGMSVGKVSETRRSLETKGLIKCQDNEDGTINVTIVDIWPQNFRHYSTPKELRCSLGEQKCSCGEQKCSPDEPKKELLRKEPIKNLLPEKTPEDEGERTATEYFGPRPAREEKPETDFLKDLSPENRAFALASGLAAAEHEKRGTGMAVTPEQEGESLLRKFCEIHDAPMPKAERVRIRQARILVQCKEGVEADSQACERALAVLKEEYAFRTYNSVDDKGFQRDFAAEAHRAMQSRSKRSASEPQPLRTKDWATGKWVDWEQGEGTND